MGTLIYDSSSRFEIDDRALAHLQVVVVDKLRRRESFEWRLRDETHEASIWVTPATPLEFVYSGNRSAGLNRAWLEILSLAASSTGGLSLIDEPTEIT